MPDRNPVGIVGIGLLGQALAQRLLGAGFDVAGFDVDAAKNAKLLELGGRPATSVADLAERCDPIVLAVFSTDQVEEVIEKELLPVLGESSGTHRAVRQHLRPRPHRRARRRASPRGACAFSRRRCRASSGQVGARRRRRPDRRRSARTPPRSSRILRALFPTLFPHRQGRRRRARQARDQSHPRAQPRGAGRGTGVRPAARARCAGVPRRGAQARRPIRRSWTSRGRKMVRGEFDPEGRVTQHLKDVHLDARAGRAQSASSCRCSRSMPTCWRPACAPARATSTIAP